MQTMLNFDLRKQVRQLHSEANLPYARYDLLMTSTFLF